MATRRDLGFSAMDSRLSASLPYDADLILQLSSRLAVSCSPAATFTPGPLPTWKFLMQTHYWFNGVRSNSQGTAKSSPPLAADLQDLRKLLQHGVLQISDSFLLSCGTVARMSDLAAYSLGCRHYALHNLYCQFSPGDGPHRCVQGQGFCDSAHGLVVQPCRSLGTDPAFSSTFKSLDPHQTHFE